MTKLTESSPLLTDSENTLATPIGIPARADSNHPSFAFTASNPAGGPSATPVATAWASLSMPKNSPATPIGISALAALGKVGPGPWRDEHRTLADATVTHARHRRQSAHVSTCAYVPVDVNHASLSATVGVSIGAAATAGGAMAHDGVSPSPLQADDLSRFVSKTGDAAAAVFDTTSLLSVGAGKVPATESMTVTTDKADYPPGGTAIFVVAGVNSGSSVAFHVADLASDPGINGIADVYAPFSVTDGGPGDSDGLANGVVVTQWQVPSDGSATGATLQLTAASGSQTATTTFSDANAIALENEKPGTPESVWLLDQGEADSSIEGYAAQFSLNHGETVDFKIDTNSKKYTIDIYRLGYYDGDGARKVATINKDLATAQVQPDPLFNSTTKLVDAGNWSVSASWNIPADAVSGVYIAELTRLDGSGGRNMIPFIVRDDEHPSDITFQTADTTWQAYNWWGGYNFYGSADGGGQAARASAVSYNRPIITRDGGVSAGPWDYIFGAEYSAIRWLEQNGYDINYISGIDTARYPAQLLPGNTKVFLSVGHDEYWSADQRDNVEAARDAGVNLAFLSGNEVYWETRWANSISADNTPYKTLVSYKETWSRADVDPSNTTGTWRDPQFGAGEPENALTGTIFTVDSYRLDTIKIPYNLSNFRFWTNTDVAKIQPGQVYSLTPNLLGYEWDSDLDNGFRPAGLINLSSTTVDVDELLLDYGNTTGPGTATHSLTLYRDAESGALVFGAGTVYWSWGLDSHHDAETTPTDPNVQQAMVNLFADMGVQPETLMLSLKVATQSTDHTAPTSTITSPTASGSYTAAQPITITGTTTDAGGGSVAVVEVSTDGGASWHRVTGFENWTYTWVPLAGGTYTIKSRAVDDSVNMETTPSTGNTITISVAPAPTVSLFPSGSPAILTDTDVGFVNLGVKFTSSQSGSIVGLRYYKGLGDGGTHVGSLWTSNGQMLRSATFTQETASGWQTVTFSSPVSISAGTSYVASYHSNGHYADTENYFTSAHTNGPLTAQAGNGYYTYSNNVAFPTTASNGINYWIDVIYSPANTVNQPPVGVNDSGFAVTRGTPRTFPASDFLANDTDPNGDILTITGVVDGSVVNGTASFNSQTNVVTFTPDAGYIGPASFEYSISDGRGGTSLAIVSMTVVPPSNSLFSSSDVPAVLSDSDTSQVNLGVRFTSSAAGSITGIKYYKGANDTGTHTGSLWSSTGASLATATFTNESTSGWQTVTFSSPVSITASATYVASFHSNGHYTSTSNYFTTPHVNGALTAPASNNGVYTYGIGNLLPTSTYAATNYWVDVLFNYAPIAVNDSSFSTTMNTSLAIPASALLANDTDPDGDPVTVTGASGGVNGSANFDTQTNTVTFTPTTGYTGPASFSYAISDGKNNTTTGTVSLTVTAPAGETTLTGTDGPDTIPISATQWAGFSTIDLGNGTDILNVVASGDISLLAAPVVSNVETGNLTGTVSGDSITLTGVQLDAIIIGGGAIDLGDGADAINITSTSADLNALGATDPSISGVEAISAAAAAASVTITLSGHTEGFTITGSANADTITGGLGADAISAGGGNDTINLANGQFAAGESIDGGGGTDTIVLTNATTVDFDTGAVSNVETLAGSGNADNVTLSATTGFTTINLNAGVDSLTLAAGGNTLTASNVETITGGTGNDAITLGAALASGTIDLGGGTDSLTLAAGGNTLTASNVETITGGTGNDAITLGAALASGTIDLGGGTDTLTLAAGGNTLTVSNTETIAGGTGNDAITLGAAQGSGAINLGDGTDTLTLAAGGNTLTVSNAETITGGTGNDAITLGAAQAASVIDLLGGADSLTLAAGGNTLTVSRVETITGGAGDDTITLGATQTSGTINLGGGADSLTLADGANTLTASNVETITGGTGNDAITLGAALASGTIDLGGGTDSLTLAAGGNNVTVTNVETITGGSGADIITVLGAGGSTIIGGAGVDTITGGGGNDTIRLANSDFASGELINAGAGTDSILLTNPTTVNFTTGAVGDVATLTGSSGNDTVTMLATQWAGFTTINLGAGTNGLTVAANGDITALGMPTIANVTTGNLTGTGSNDTVTGSQLDAIIIGGGTINLGAGAADTINLTATSADLNALGATNSRISGVEAISAAAATAGVTITLSAQTEAFMIAGSANGDIITSGAGNDTIGAGGGNDTITAGGGADIVSAGSGDDTINLASGQSPGTVAGSGDAGTITGFDSINDFDPAIDVLNLNGAPTVSRFSTTTDSTLTIGGQTVKSHAISNGIVTFDYANTFSAALTLTSTANVAAVVQYLHNNDLGNAGASVAFVATIDGTAHTYIFEQVGNTRSSTNDILVDLVGVTLTSGVTSLSTLIGNAHVMPAGVAGAPINLALGDPAPDRVGDVTVSVAGVPAGWTLSAGVDNGNGVWSVAPSDPSSLTVTPLSGFVGAHLLQVTETWTGADGSTASITLSDNVEAFAPDNPIFAWSSDDNLTGSSGDDLFVLAQPIGNDTIHSFDVAHDKVDLIGFSGLSGFIDVQTRLSENSSGDAVVAIAEGELITFDGVSAASLTANNFVFNRDTVMGNANSIVIGDNALLPLAGTVNNRGTIELTSSGGQTRLQVLANGLTLEGGGRVDLSDSNGNIIVGTTPDATLTNVDNTISGAGQLGNGQLTLHNEGTIIASGVNALTIDTGANAVVNSGTLEAIGSGGLVIDSDIANSGLLWANGGNITIDGNVSGTGSARIDGVATFEIGGAFGENIMLDAGANATLKIDHAADFRGAVAGFDGNDALDLADLAFGGNTTLGYMANSDNTGGTLTVSDGAHTANIALLGQYMAGSFVMSADGFGGTLIHDLPPATQTHTLTQPQHA